MIERLQNVAGADVVLSFSKYIYRPQSSIDERVVIQVPISDITESWLSNELDLLPNGWELALNSTVHNWCEGLAYIPMVDFVGKARPAELRKLVAKVLGPTILEHCEYYDSGRSMHGYVPMVVPVTTWQSFMGGLLLLNLPNKEPVVDARWVGHRLRSGYASLRWSANTSHYLRLPTLVED